MTRRLKKQWVLLLAGMAPLLWGGHPAWALNVSPGRTEVRLDPGKSTKLVLAVVNDEPEKLSVQVSGKDWFVLPANQGYPVDKWLKIHGPLSFNLSPGESRNIKVTVTCPRGVEGELVGMVSFLYQTGQPSMVTPMISVSVYVAAAGTEKIAGEIKDMAVRLWRDQLQVAVSVKAAGNVHLRPTGQVVLVDAKGTEVARWPIPEGDPAYPGMERGYFAKIPSGFKLAPGRYTAKADLVYKGLEMKADQGFTVSPEGKIETVGSATK